MINLQNTVETLKWYVERNDLFGFPEEELEAMRKTLYIMEGELEHEADQLAHSEVTIEMEQGKDIPLTAWARKHGIEPATARQKAIRGKLKTAHKVGRDWMISELEDNVDNRRKN